MKVARSYSSQSRFAEASALFARALQLLPPLPPLPPPANNTSFAAGVAAGGSRSESSAPLGVDQALFLADLLHDWGKALFELEDVAAASVRTMQARDLILHVCFPQVSQV